jgi:conjugative relaxase-like TrwC/TraI family protein
MLRITVSKGGKAAVNYFRDALSQQDYYSERGQVLGQWQGKMANRLGLGKEVTAQAFEMMVSNRNPITGEKITPRDSAKRRAGYDFTFNAAKSISLVYAITKDEEILEAHRAAIKKAMLAVEKDIQTQVGQGKQKRYATTGNLVYAAFEHHTSRPVAHEIDGATQYLADPHLHSHCFVMNATWNEEKSRYQAIEVGTIKKNAIYYEALYHSYLAENLQKAGYQVTRSKLGIEIAGIERSTIDKYSNRTQEIEKAAKEKGVIWEKDKAQLGAKTRHRKTQGVGKEALEKAWADRLSLEERFNIQTLKGTYGKNGLAVEKNSDALSPDKAIDLALQHYMERKSAVPKKQVLGYAMKLSLGQQTPTAIEAELQERHGEEVFTGAKNSDTYLTTKETLLAEREMKNFAVSTRGQFVPLNPEYEIQQDFLNEGQRNAIQHTLQSQDQVIMISGAAGVGKTTLMKEVKTGIEASNKKLFAFAPSAAASRGVLRSKSFEGADTIKKLLDDEKLQSQLKDQVILIDEAGMVGTKTMNGIFQIAQEQNARVILSGDYRQHQSVESGDAQRLLEQESGLPVARVNEIVRQTDQSKYREAVKSLAEGNYNQGFEQLDGMNSIIEIEDQDKRHEQIAKDYLDCIQAPPIKERNGKTSPRTAIVVSPTHAEGKAITMAIREQLKEEGLVDQEERTFHILRKLSFTETEKQDALNYQEGMSIQFHKNYEGFKAGQSYDVSKVSKEGEVPNKQQRNPRRMVPALLCQ